MTVTQALQAALGNGTDPSGVPWSELTPEVLRRQRTSVKWRMHAADVLPMFVAEMDFTIAPQIRRTLVERVEASDLGYLLAETELATAFAGFARDRWGWVVNEEHVHLATDVATGIVETLRVFLPEGGRLVLPTATYPGFFEMLQELPFEVVEVRLVEDSGEGSRVHLDLEQIGREFENGATALLLGNPHNPHGVAFTSEELTELARLAAEHGVFVLSDEIHAPLTHHGHTFHPFAPIAAEQGALSVTASSASKGFNLAGAKCSLLVAADDRANQILNTLPPEVLTRVSILGFHAAVTAFTQCRDWLDRAIVQIERNQQLLSTLLAELAPKVGYLPAEAGYLAWLDFSATELGERPATRILQEAKVALNDGITFGSGGSHHARLNLACAPETLQQGVQRIASIL